MRQVIRQTSRAITPLQPNLRRRLLRRRLRQQTGSARMAKAASSRARGDDMTKRASGESSISKGADGRWHGYVSMGVKAGGRRDRRHVAAVKRADVVTQVRALEEQRDAGIVLA